MFVLRDACRVGFEPTVALPMTSPIRCIKQLRLDRYPLPTQETALDPANGLLSSASQEVV